MRPPHGKQVLLVLRAAPDHPRTRQALRTAVGYLTADLQVTVLCCGPATALWRQAQRDPAALPPAVRRPLDTLRLFGQSLLCEDQLEPAAVAALLRRAQAVVSW